MTTPIRTAALLLLAITLGLSSCASTPDENSSAPPLGRTKVEWDSQQLMMKNSEQLGDMVRRKIKKAQDIQAKQEVDDDQGIVAEPEAIDQMRDALRLVLSRPDQDGARAPLFDRLRRELTDLNSLDPVLNELTTEAIEGVKEPSTPARFQATYIVLLENLMAEIKSEVGSVPSFKAIIERIRDADIKVTDRVKTQQLLRAMNRPSSPSETAARIVPRPKK